MSNEYTVDDLLGFLEHASDRGLLPAATAQALAVASRNVFGVLESGERNDLRALDLAAVVKRFQNKRARDFTPSSLKEYERRVNRAVALFMDWKADPSNFKAATRSTQSARRRTKASILDEPSNTPPVAGFEPPFQLIPGTYQTSVPLGPGRIVTLANVPMDLTTAEANRLVRFVQMLAVEPDA